jgi:hypothetical protein
VRRILVTLFVGLFAFLVYGLAVDSPFISYYVPITLVLTAAIALVHRTARFPEPVLWALVAVALGNVAGGVLLVDGRPLYMLEMIGPVRYDKLFHTAATGVAAWAAWEALLRWSGPHAALGGLAFAAVLMASGAGALVEVVEYAGTVIFANTNVGDYGDNMLDLTVNLLGAVAVAVFLWRRTARLALR